MHPETKYWVLLSSITGIGPKTFRKLNDEFGTPKAVLEAPREELSAIPRVKPEAIDEMKRGLRELAGIEVRMLALETEGVRVLTLTEEAYPRALQAVPDAPPVLYVRGEILPEDENAVAVVGSRAASGAALAFARELAGALVRAGITVVSGLAQGIDGAAHSGALEADGRTLAVLGSGIRVIFPTEHMELAARIERHGAVLSELHPDTRASGPNLMARDRLVSGLSRAVVVVEAEPDSGSMDTAQKAEKQGRLVFAVSWPDGHPGCGGNRELLGRGVPALDSDGPTSIERLLSAMASETTRPERPPQQLRLF